jgi:SAM-dependent methyltransferase
MTPKTWLKQLIDPRVSGAMQREMPRLASKIQKFALWYPQDDGADSHARSARAAAPGEPMPVPPRSLWAGYGTSAEGYLASGREDAEVMRKLLGDSGAPIEDAGRILDLGVAGGRMIRHLADLTPRAEIWGCDIWADAIDWCQENLSPPFRFAVTTAVPHLPFEDRSFGLVYCGSLFTHLDDLADAWFLELHRIIRSGGRLLFSVNDRHAAKIFAGEADPASYPGYYERVSGRDVWDHWVTYLNTQPVYKQFVDGDAWMISMSRLDIPHVMWDPEVLCERLSYGWRCCSVNPESYGHQTMILLERI